MSSGLFVCMVLWEPFIGCFIGCFIGGRLLCGVCLTYSRQRPERSRMAIAEGRRLGGFLCPYAERTYGALRLPEITLSGFSRSVFRLFSIVCFARLYFVVGCFCVVSGCALSFRPFGRFRPIGAFPVIHALFSRLFRMPQIPVLSDPQPPERPQDEASDGGGQRQPTAGLSSPPAGSGGDDAAGRADDSRHNGRYVCRCAMFGHPVVAVACEGETKPGRGRCRFCGCLAGIAGRLGIFGIFGACRKRRGRLAGFPERGERSGSISGVGGCCRRSCCRWRRGCYYGCRWRCCCRRFRCCGRWYCRRFGCRWRRGRCRRFRCCGRWYCRRFRCLCYCLYRRVCRLRGHLPALRFDAENAVEDMASFAAEQHHVARLQGLTSGGKTVGVGICGGVGGGFVSREPVLLSGGCCRFGISGVSGDRGQYRDVAFAAQQGPHAVARHADLDFVSFGEHRFDLLEKQTVRKLHHGRGFADSPPKIVRQASSAAAASGRHSRW